MPFDQNRPYVVKETAGRKSWCACGESKKKPYCDGSHREAAPGIHSMKVDIAEDKIVAWCGCGKSQNKPFCDGSHSRC